MNSNRRITRGAAACACARRRVLAAACTVGPDFVRPTPQAPPHWSAHARPCDRRHRRRTSRGHRASRGAAAPGGTAFEDPELDSLIDRAASKSNLDLRAARAANRRSARAARRFRRRPSGRRCRVDASYDPASASARRRPPARFSIRSEPSTCRAARASPFRIPTISCS